MNTLLAPSKLKLDFSWLKRKTAIKSDENNLPQHETRVPQNQVIEHLRQVEANYFLERKTFW